MSAAPNRPVLRYHGGKWRLAPWLIGFFPAHRVYVEPYGGGASVLLRKPPSHGEVYNDVFGEVVNVFRVLRDPVTAAELRRLSELTPFARDEFNLAREAAEDPIEEARRTIARSFMGFGSASANRAYATGFRANSNRSGTTPAQDWINWPAEIPAFVERLRGVVIENRPALEVIAQQDSPETLFYVDPPYPFVTRGNLNGVRQKYVAEMTDDDHRALAVTLHDVKGMVVLSGYPCDLYDVELYADWQRHERPHFADGAVPKTEVIWLNKACADAIGDRATEQERLFA